MPSRSICLSAVLLFLSAFTAMGQGSAPGWPAPVQTPRPSALRITRAQALMELNRLETQIRMLHLQLKRARRDYERQEKNYEKALEIGVGSVTSANTLLSCLQRVQILENRIMTLEQQRSRLMGLLEQME